MCLVHHKTSEGWSVLAWASIINTASESAKPCESITLTIPAKAHLIDLTTGGPEVLILSPSEQDLAGPQRRRPNSSRSRVRRHLWRGVGRRQLLAERRYHVSITSTVARQKAAPTGQSGQDLLPAALRQECFNRARLLLQHHDVPSPLSVFGHGPCK